MFFIKKKREVDFLLSKIFEAPVPIKIGHETKDKRKVLKAMNRYDSSHGIIVSQTTKTIEKDGNIIYIPIKTFSYI